jgi:hypothetical protein
MIQMFPNKKQTFHIFFQFLYIYDLYDKLFSVLKPEAFFIRAERLRHHLVIDSN